MDKSEDSKVSHNGVNGYHESSIVENGDSDETKPVLDTAKHNEPTSVNSYYCMWTLLIMTGSTMMSMGLAVGALNPTLNIISDFYNETYIGRYGDATGIPSDTLKLLIAMTVSMILGGGFLGALSIGLIAKFFTRKQAMIFINTINIIAVACSSIIGYLTQSYEAIIIGRFFMGFVSGVSMNLTPIITSETSTRQRSAFYLSLIGVNLSFGGLMGLILGYEGILGTEYLWPVLLAIPALPSLIYVIASPWLPETPSYLLLIGQKKEALQTLSQLRLVSDESLLEKELVDIRHEQQAKEDSVKSVPLITMFRKPGYRWQLFLVVMVFMYSQFCGVNGIGMYTNTIFLKAQISEDLVTFASMIVYTVQFFVTIAGSTAVNRWGPRRLAIFWTASMTLALTLLTVSMATVANLPGMAYLSVAAVTLYILSWACGPNITLFPLVAALTTEPTRESSFKFGGGLFWIASWFVSFIPTYLLEHLEAYAFVPWAVCNLFFTIFIYFCIPETFGKTSEQIQAEIHKRRMKKTGTETAMELLEKTDITA